MKRARDILGAAAILVAFGFAPLYAEEDPPTPAPAPGDVLRIPGLPPIQLPPGARAFGPQGRQGPDTLDRDDSRTSRPNAAEDGARDEPRPRMSRKGERTPPHSVPSEQAQRAKIIDHLFGQLKSSGDPDSAKGVADAIERVWLHSGSDTADLLMGRAVSAMAGKDLATAENLLDSLLAIEPDWSEAWNKRATVRFLRDNIDGAMSDVEETLRREPRHFGALAGLGAILQKSDLDRRALEAYRRALDVYPEQPEVRKLVEKLQLEVEGRDI